MTRSGRYGVTGTSDRRLAELIGSVCQTMEWPERWPAVLAEIATTLNAKSGLIRTLDLRGRNSVLASHYYNLDDTLQTEYCDGLVTDDPYLEALRRRPAGRMVTNDGLIDLEALRRTRFYKTYLGPLDNHFVVGGFVERDDEGRYTILGFHRHRRAVQFDRAQLAFMQELAPHVRRAVRLQRMLGHERRRADSAEGALDALSVAALLLDRQGRLVHANAQGERLLRNGHGLRLRNGQVIASDGALAGPVDALIARAREGAEGRARPSAESALLPAHEAGMPSQLAVAVPVERPVSSLRDHWPGARVALYVGDLDDTGTLRPEVLRTLYGLTEAEARLAIAIGRGRELPRLSEDWNVSTETLRTHLKAVFAKIGVNRQVDLVRLLAGTTWKLTTPLAQEKM